MNIVILAKKRNGGNPLIPLSDILSEYKFENNVLDTVGINDGTPTSITYEAGLVGQSGIFNGTTSNVDLGTTTLIGGKNNVSLSCLYKGSGEIYGSFGTPSMMILRQNDASIQWFIVTSSGQVGGTIEINADYANWHHLAVTYDGATMKAYLDGVISATTFSQTGNINTGSSENEKIGQERLNRFAGNIDSLRIWDKALNQEEITEISTLELAGTDINP